jgi:hypothetical protein
MQAMCFPALERNWTLLLCTFLVVMTPLFRGITFTTAGKKHTNQRTVENNILEVNKSEVAEQEDQDRGKPTKNGKAYPRMSSAAWREARPVIDLSSQEEDPCEES